MYLRLDSRLRRDESVCLTVDVKLRHHTVWLSRGGTLAEEQAAAAEAAEAAVEAAAQAPQEGDFMWMRSFAGKLPFMTPFRFRQCIMFARNTGIHMKSDSKF